MLSRFSLEAPFQEIIFMEKRTYQITFEPKQDITTYELARCLKFYVLVLAHKDFFEAEIYEQLFLQLPQELRRHFDVAYKG